MPSSIARVALPRRVLRVSFMESGYRLHEAEMESQGLPLAATQPPEQSGRHTLRLPLDSQK